MISNRVLYPGRSPHQSRSSMPHRAICVLFNGLTGCHLYPDHYPHRAVVVEGHHVTTVVPVPVLLFLDHGHLESRVARLLRRCEAVRAARHLSDRGPVPCYPIVASSLAAEVSVQPRWRRGQMLLMLRESTPSPGWSWFSPRLPMAWWYCGRWA